MFRFSISLNNLSVTFFFQHFRCW